MAISDHTQPKIIELTFSFQEFAPARKNEPSAHFWTLWPEWPHQFRPSTPQNFWSAFNFCDHVSTCQKSVYLFHLFILQMQLILESHHQTGHTHFWPCTFLTMTTHISVWNCASMQKNNLVPSVLSHDIVNFSPETRLATLIFDYDLTKTFQSTFNFCEFVSTYKKWDCFIKKCFPK